MNICRGTIHFTVGALKILSTTEIMICVGHRNVKSRIKEYSWGREDGSVGKAFAVHSRRTRVQIPSTVLMQGACGSQPLFSVLGRQPQGKFDSKIIQSESFGFK